MTKIQDWWKGPRRHIGLLLMGLSVLVGVTTGVLAFEKVVTVEMAYGAMVTAFLLLFLPGFILHLVVVARTRGSNGA
jgi:hypothetical protein